MKIQILSAAALLAGLQNIGTSAWAPAITTLATRKVSSRYITSHYVAGNVEKQKGADEDKTSAVFQESKPKILGEPIPYSELTIGVLKETFKGENRVSQTPDSLRSLVKAGFTVIVQSGGT
jgi:NAD(P) transhydrogenase